jgi:integrase
VPDNTPDRKASSPDKTAYDPADGLLLCLHSRLCTVVLSSYKAAVQLRNPPPAKPTRLLDVLRERARYLHYSLRTEKAYLYRARFFIRWSGMKHPRDMGAAEVQAFLGMLVTQRQVSSSTHNQALSALLFLYREVLGIQLPWLQELQRPTRPKRIPAVLTREEVSTLLSHMAGEIGLVARLLYGTGSTYATVSTAASPSALRCSAHMSA